MADEKQEKPVEVTLSKDELEQITNDIEKAKEQLVSKTTDQKLDAIERAKLEAKEEAKKEIEDKQKQDALVAENARLQEQLQAQQKLAEEKLTDMDTKIKNMVKSKQVIASEDPFKSTPAMSDKIDQMTNDEVDTLEEQSAREFFGADYDNRI